MRKIKSIIVDDERPARRELNFLLKDISELEVLGEADNLADAAELIQKHKPRLVFLDIQLRGENGFDLLEQVCVDFKVIFVTAYDEFAIRAFDVNACDYLLKPVDPERLKIAIERILSKTEEDKPGKKKYSIKDSIYLKQTTGPNGPDFGLRPEAVNQRSTKVDGFLLPPCAERKVSGKQ